MKRRAKLVFAACLAAWAGYALAKRVRYGAELRRLLASLDGTAPPLTYQDLVDTDGDPVTEEEFQFLIRQHEAERT